MRCARAVRFRRAHPEVHIFGNDHDGWYASFPVQGRRGYEWYIYRENLGIAAQPYRDDGRPGFRAAGGKLMKGDGNLWGSLSDRQIEAAEFSRLREGPGPVLLGP